MTLDLTSDPAQTDRIEKFITDAASPVGIDAKKTHVLIIKKLLDIEARLEALERARTK
jgi:hypothetical protein